MWLSLFVTALFSYSASALELKFLDSVHWPSEMEFGESRVGGISGLSLMASGRHVAICDDRGLRGPTRAYILELQLHPETQKLQVSIQREVALKNEEGKPLPSMYLDGEAIVDLPGGSWLVSTEGETKLRPRLAPEILSFSHEGKKVGSVPVPEKFLPEARGKQTKGVRNNEALESLTLAPDLVNLFAIAESSLLQDGDAPTFAAGSLVRMIHWQRGEGAGFAAKGEYAYPLSAVPKLIEGGGVEGEIGVSEALALDADSLLVLERAWVTKGEQGMNGLKLFRTSRGSGEEISGKQALLGEKVKPMEKTLVLDFAEIVPLLPEKHRRLDNWEAMAWGPKTKGGNRTLVFASDSNFSERQETQFVIFEVKDSPARRAGAPRGK